MKIWNLNLYLELGFQHKGNCIALCSVHNSLRSWSPVTTTNWWTELWCFIFLPSVCLYEYTRVDNNTLLHMWFTFKELDYFDRLWFPLLKASMIRRTRKSIPFHPGGQLEYNLFIFYDGTVLFEIPLSPLSIEPTYQLVQNCLHRPLSY